MYFSDMDGKDQQSYHVLGYNEETLVVYSRLLPAGVSYQEASIGRVVSHQRYRKHGYGRLLMEYSIQQCHQLFGAVPIRIGAQLYLKNFYKSFGFVQISSGYLEDGIPHIEMILHA